MSKRKLEMPFSIHYYVGIAGPAIEDQINTRWILVIFIDLPFIETLYLLVNANLNFAVFVFRKLILPGKVY